MSSVLVAHLGTPNRVEEGSSISGHICIKTCVISSTCEVTKQTNEIILLGAGRNETVCCLNSLTHGEFIEISRKEVGIDERFFQRVRRGKYNITTW